MVFSFGRYHPLIFGIGSGVTSYYINCRINDAQWKYSEENKDKCKAWKHGVVKCECGNTYTTANKARHFKTKSHLSSSSSSDD